MGVGKTNFSAYDLLVDEFDGKEFETYEEYEEAVMNFITDLVEEIGKAERWACQNRDDIHEEMGVEIMENEEEDED